MEKQRIYIKNRVERHPEYKKQMADIRVRELDLMRISGMYEDENLTNIRRYDLILRAEGFIYGR